jgi:hypothetical protein
MEKEFFENALKQKRYQNTLVNKPMTTPEDNKVYSPP